MLVALALVCSTALVVGAARRSKPKAPGAVKDKVSTLLEELVSDFPTPGRFYQIQPEDAPLAVALEALGPEAQAQDGVEYLRCISSGPRWNMPLYATTSPSKQYPNAYLVPGVRLGVRVAFLPRNEDALDLMLRGRMPKTAVDPTSGKPISEGSSYGLLWLPPVDDEFSCAGYEWEDGSSAIDPPPDLFEVLE